MADYYPRIARAIAGLDPSAPGESRRALYERARAALIAQLRTVEPPLSESEITRERLSLEEAVRKVESEAAQRARDARSGAGAGGASRGGDAFRRANARQAADTPPSTSQPAAAPSRSRPSAPPSPPRAPLGQDERGDQRANRNPRADAPPPLPRPQPPSQPQVTMADPQLPPAQGRTATPSRRGEAPPQ